MSHFVERLEDLISDTNLSVKQFAKKVGIHYTAIFKWLNGSVPYLKSLMTLAEFFNCSLEYLLGRTLQKTKLSKNTPIPFSDVLKKFNKKKGVTIYRLSKDLQINTSDIYSWLKNLSMPKVLTLIKLCDYYNCTFDEIVGLESFEKNNK